MQFYHNARSAAPMPLTEPLGSPLGPKMHEKTLLKIAARKGLRKSRANGAEGRPRSTKVRQSSPKWSQNGGPGPSRNGPERGPGPKRRDMQSDAVFTMFQPHQPVPKTLIFAPFWCPKVEKKRGFGPRSTKTLSKAVPIGPKWRQWGPYGVPRVPHGLQNASKMLPKIMQK